MDVEKTMQFILDVQARLEASAAAHDDRLAKIETSIQKHDEQIATVTGLVGRVAQAQIHMAERMAAGFQELRELHADTGYKLNALIETVDKLVRRNGHKE
jgi:hypothetical protein